MHDGHAIDSDFKGVSPAVVGRLRSVNGSKTAVHCYEVTLVERLLGFKDYRTTPIAAIACRCSFPFLCATEKLTEHYNIIQQLKNQKR
mmetsp:Transcript_17933/g.41152  ORF Transcript_17933/g.41152 Transcript_17933/m.41152 type:complete len:88 (+) Transcript_17933:111-374(+)